MSEKENYAITFDLDNLYLLHAALRTLALNMDFMRTNMYDDDEATEVEIKIQNLADCIELNISKLEGKTNGIN